MSLMLYNHKEKYIAADKRFLYHDSFYPEDICNKLFTNRDNTISYTVVGALLNEEQFTIFDLLFKNWYYSKRTKEDLKDLNEDFKSTFKTTIDYMDTHILIMLKDEIFLYETGENPQVIVLESNLHFVQGNGRHSAWVALIVDINNPFDIFNIASLSDTEVSKEYDIKYQKDLKKIKKKRDINVQK